MTNDVKGINHSNVTEWLVDHSPDAAPPFTFELIAGGHSNITFKVTDAKGQHLVLRRPPLFQVLATAHDMEREFKIINALQGSDVPVPFVVGLCTDEAINDRPFYVMEYVEGTIIRDDEIARAWPTERRRPTTESLIDGLAKLHAVDVDAVGLGDLGRKEAYIERQLKRWLRQFEESKIDERPIFNEVHAQLAKNIPPQQGVGIVHGDYRLDNCMIADDGTVAAVLDWELCTLGDVLADVSQLLTYWTEPGDDRTALDNAPTSVGGFPTRAEVLDMYEQASGRSMANIDFYLSFSSWRLASILEGVNSRYINGAMGDKEHDGEVFLDRINGLLATASEHAELI